AEWRLGFVFQFCDGCLPHCDAARQVGHRFVLFVTSWFKFLWFKYLSPEKQEGWPRKASLLRLARRHRKATVRRVGCDRANPSSLASAPAVTAASESLARAGELLGQAGEAGGARGARGAPPGAGEGLDHPLADRGDPA